MKYSDLDTYSKKDFIDLITKLNSKIVFLQREKSKNSISGKSDSYKSKLCKSMIVNFLQKDCKHELDDVPSINEYSLKDFRNRISKFDDDKL